jgi:transposase-like protein
VSAEDYPKTLLELEARFSDEAACRQYLEALRWPDGFVCPRCGGTRAWAAQRARHVCVACRHQATVTAGTIFHDRHLPLPLLFRAFWQVTSQKYGASALGVQRVLGLGSYETAWSWLHKLRRAMVRPGRERLSGRVEVDETYVGGMAEGKRGRGAERKALVVIAAQEDGPGLGRIRLARVPDAGAASLVGFVQQSVTPGSTVHTDGWRAYAGLEDAGYRHEFSCLRDQGPEAATKLLPRVHRVAALLKRWLLGTHQGAVQATHLDYYLDEFTFRFNRRTSASRGKLFYRLVAQAVQVEPAPRDTLVGGKRNSNPNPLGSVESKG